MSLDETGIKFFFKHFVFEKILVQRLLDPFEDPSKVVDFWGKNRVSNNFIHYIVKLTANNVVFNFLSNTLQYLDNYTCVDNG